MRVISGRLKGKKLISPIDERVRPTLDRIKETLFNIIQFDVQNSTFLDLFSGSGGIGIEAVSRGAREVIFCDIDRDSLKVLKANLKNLDINSFVYEGDFRQLLKRQPPEKFDFIYIDPPYAGDCVNNALSIIAEKNLLKIDGCAIVEKLTDDKREFCADGLTMTQSRKMGNVTLMFFKRSDNE